MKIQCDFCGNTYEDYLEKCPSCGAPNPSHHDGDKQPRTIEELKKWYEDRQLPPPETTRFFIGVDYGKPKAFGIYKDDNNEFVVYKNKADGSRVIRYRGKDETYAVDELFQKLKDEIVHQKARNGSRRRQTKTDRRIRQIGSVISTIIALAFIAVFVFESISDKRHNGYYNYGDVVYYNDAGNWYYFDDDDDDWYTASTPAQYDPDNTDPYFMGRSYEDVDWESADQDFMENTDESPETVPDVTDSSAYRDYHSSDSDSGQDSDYDWDSGSDSWDFDGSDWDSDW